ncbi:hypothetical protein [Coleofasciculus sp. G2-EDA-02]
MQRLYFIGAGLVTSLCNQKDSRETRPYIYARWVYIYVVDCGFKTDVWLN